MHIDPNDPDAEQNGSSFFPMILAIVISVIALWLVVPNSRRHAVALDESPSPAATAPASPASPTQPAPTP